MEANETKPDFIKKVSDIVTSRLDIPENDKNKSLFVQVTDGYDICTIIQGSCQNIVTSLCTLFSDTEQGKHLFREVLILMAIKDIVDKTECKQENI